MSINDKKILDKILEEKQKEIAPGSESSDFFELYTAEQILKDYDLSYQEIESGIVGNSGDGGIDSAYVFLNGELVQEDTEDFSQWKKNIELEFVLIQSKTSSGFSEDAILKFNRTLGELLNLEHDLEDYKNAYNNNLLKIIERFRLANDKLASRFPSINISIYYITKAIDVDPNVARQTEIITQTVSSLFSNAKTNFRFIGAPDLLRIARKQPITSHILTIAENPMSSRGEEYICLVRLKDYYQFITDENGKIKRHIFESNVRDYQGSTAVNQEIQETLEEEDSKEEFWWLNNGVTVLASKATAQGGKAIIVEDPEIVNGLQSSTEIYNFFQKYPDKEDSRTVLLRVIVPQSVASRDKIIKATNSQTKIPPVSLRATDKIHRDIEEYLKPYGFFYDRRKNHYKNEGKPVSQIISLSYLAQSLMAMVLQRPDTARARPSTLLKRDEEYERIFNVKHPIQLYLVITQLMKRVESFLKEQDLETKHRTNIRFYVAFSTVVHIVEKITPAIKQISEIKVEDIPNEKIQTSYILVKALFDNLGASDQIAKGTELLEKLNERHREQFTQQFTV